MRLKASRLDPVAQRSSCRLGDLELNWALRLVLHDACTRVDAVAVSDVANMQADQIAAAKLGVDGEIEERQVSRLAAELQAYADGPDVGEAERGPLAREFALVPGFVGDSAFEFHDGAPGRDVRPVRCLSGNRNYRSLHLGPCPPEAANDNLAPDRPVAEVADRAAMLDGRPIRDTQANLASAPPKA